MVQKSFVFKNCSRLQIGSEETKETWQVLVYIETHITQTSECKHLDDVQAWDMEQNNVSSVVGKLGDNL